MVSPDPGDSRADISAQNHASGCQYLGPGEGDQNVVSSNGVQFNDRSDHRQYATFLNLQADTLGIPSVWNLAQALKGLKAEPTEPTKTVLIQWLMRQDDCSPIDVHRQHLEIFNQATPETGKWILDNKELQKWKDPSILSHRYCGIHGILGSGKTVLASLIIDSLKTEIKERNDTACTYFYFNDGDDKSPPVAQIWSTLLLQLLQHRNTNNLAEELRSKFNNSFRGSAPIHPLEYIELFKSQSSVFKTVYLIIDALDSCTNSKDEKTRQRMQEALRKLPNNVRVLLTSRSESLVRDFGISQIIKITPHRQDINTYIQDQISKDFDLDRVLEDPTHQEEVIKKVTGLTLKSGMYVLQMYTDQVQRRLTDARFLLAKLHLHNLSKQGTLNDIKEALKQLPATSSRAFEASIRRILRSDNAFEADLARHVFTWIVHAKGGLTIDQVRDSFAIQKSKGNQYLESRPPKDAILSSCAGLVVEDHETKTLKLVHESLKEYLQIHKVFTKRPGLRIAETCLTTLLLGESQRAQSPLLIYSAMHWCSHLCKPYDSKLQKLVKTFLSDNASLTRAFRVIPGISEQTFDGITGLHASVYYNRLAWIKGLLRSGIDINSQSSNGQTALHWAAIHGRYKLLAYLVQNSADTNIRDKTGDTALHKLLMGPTVEGVRAVRSLISGGARIDIKGSRGLTPLSSAIRYGPTSIAQLLINSQTDVNAEVTAGWTSLREVFYHAHEMIHRLNHSGSNQCSDDGWTPLRDAVRLHVYHLIHLLLNMGVDLNRPTSDGWLPVLHVVKVGSPVVLQRLLERQPNPADANQRDAKDGKSALHLAFYYKQHATIRLLIKHGADINEQGPDGWTPLIQAIRENNEDLVWLLIKRGARVDQKDSNGWSPLHYAVGFRSKDIVWLLISNKASVNLSHINVPSVVDLALQKAEYSVAWLLCQNGADINGIDNKGMTSLHRACYDGRLKEVEFLLDNGVESRIKDTAGFTALHYAVLQDWEEVLSLLLSRTSVREIVDEPDDQGNSALILAILRNKENMAEALIRNGASCDDQDSAGLTALHHAARLGFDKALELLVYRTADIDLVDKQGYTVVHHAVNCNEPSIANDRWENMIRLLGSAGADLEAQNHLGLTPLMLAVQLGRVAQIRSLLLHGTAVSTRNEKGWSAFDILNAQPNRGREQTLIRRLLEGQIAPEMAAAELYRH